MARQVYSSVSRREFVGALAGAAGAMAVAPAVLGGARGGRGWGGGREEIRLGVIGCGGRGTGAVVDAMEADPAVRLVAMADLFEDRLEGSLRNLAGHERFGQRVKADEIAKFVGFDAYQKLLEERVDVVILATTPHFRPQHFEAAVAAGSHVFMEKPVAVDAPGIRRVIAAGEMADKKGLTVVAGTQRRHDPKYQALMQRLHNGEAGAITGGACWWNQGGLWVHERKPEYSDMEWQCRNWLYFCWLSGDHIVEQHVHNLDVMNWALRAHPVRALGMGGRQVRTGPEYGNIFDHFAVQYEYPGGVLVNSQARQIDGCASRVDELITTANGRVLFGAGVLEGRSEFVYKAPGVNPYVREHVDLIRSIRGEGERLNEARAVAESTLTAIMGRMSAYTGQEVSWEQALNSEWALGPREYSLGDVEADPVPVPGRTRAPAGTGAGR